MNALAQVPSRAQIDTRFFCRWRGRRDVLGGESGAPARAL
jgi:hypothetical protein